MYICESIIHIKIRAAKMGYPAVELIHNVKTKVFHIGADSSPYCNNRYNADLVSHGEIANAAKELWHENSDKPCRRCFPQGIRAYVTERSNRIAIWEAMGIKPQNGEVMGVKS